MDKFIADHPRIFRFLVYYKLVTIIAGLVLTAIAVILLVTVALPAVRQDMNEAAQREEEFAASHGVVMEQQEQMQADFDAKMALVQGFATEANAIRDEAEARKAQRHSSFEDDYAQAQDRVYSDQDN